MKSFGSKLKELRIEKGITQKTMAESLNISIPTLSHWECNYQEPAFKDLIMLSQYFNVTLEELFGLDENGTLDTSPTVGTMHEGATLTEKEKALLKAFKNLLPETQDFVLRTAQSLSDKSNVKTLNKN